MRLVGLLLIYLFILMGSAFTQTEADTTAPEPALAAAQTWLALVDAGNYPASWDTAAAYFKKVLPQDKWVTTMTAFRQPLGQVASRTFKDAQVTQSLPGAPDGQYVVIQYSSSFDKKKEALETITPMLDPDGKWRVAGYYIQ